MEGLIKDIALKIRYRKENNLCQILTCSNINPSANSCICSECKTKGLKTIDVLKQICVEDHFKITNNNLQFKCDYCGNFYNVKTNKYLRKIIGKGGGEGGDGVEGVDRGDEKSDKLCCGNCQRINQARKNLEKLNADNEYGKNIRKKATITRHKNGIYKKHLEELHENTDYEKLTELMRKYIPNYYIKDDNGEFIFNDQKAISVRENKKKSALKNLEKAYEIIKFYYAKDEFGNYINNSDKALEYRNINGENRLKGLEYLFKLFEKDESGRYILQDEKSINLRRKIISSCNKNLDKARLTIKEFFERDSNGDFIRNDDKAKNYRDNFYRRNNNNSRNFFIYPYSDISDEIKSKINFSIIDRGSVRDGNSVCWALFNENMECVYAAATKDIKNERYLMELYEHYWNKPEIIEKYLNRGNYSIRIKDICSYGPLKSFVVYIGDFYLEAESILDIDGFYKDNKGCLIRQQ